VKLMVFIEKNRTVMLTDLFLRSFTQGRPVLLEYHADRDVAEQ